MRLAGFGLVCLLASACSGLLRDGEDLGANRPGSGEGRLDGLQACDTTGPAALVRCVDRQRYQDDLAFVAQPRPPGSPHWQEVQDLCATRFAQYGFTVERQSYHYSRWEPSVPHLLRVARHRGVNVIGVRSGDGQPAERSAEVIVGAHYDHLDACPGADDNASGVAGVLEAARVLSMRSYPRTLVVACWDQEEAMMIGSAAYAERARGRGEVIRAVYDLEMIGFKNDAPGSQALPFGFDLFFPKFAAAVRANQSRADFILGVGDPKSTAQLASLETYARAVGLTFLPLPLTSSQTTRLLLGDLRRSDHAPFWRQGYPAMMLTDTANFRYPSYHCMNGPDAVGNLDTGFATDLVQATVGSAAESLGLARDLWSTAGAPLDRR